jgi:hypothetical protein
VKVIKFSYIQQHDETGRMVESILTMDQIEELQCGIAYKGYAMVARRQFTGLIDKNGKEIYEGDILQDENGTAAVEWAPGMGAWGIPDPDGCMTLLADCDEGMEIVGNIYENPERLKVQS